ncbi:ribonuclease P protein component [Endozoicomonas sp. OPT23]|uniref:ribonuclease P protein component n=1 Tax=Endozoicomonas sp. OPT23 TaxID=2072845 RepID=UPI001D83A522|nr:ribonuclease P protein component [Endozoicomonas sp. OPT23]
MSFAFGRELRLCSAADFKQVFDHTDIKVSNRHLLILARENNLDHPRLGLVIAKKNIRFATGRNRVKRHIRETYRLNQDDLGNLDIVVLARRGLGELESCDINKLLTRQWSKLHQKLGDRQARRQASQQKQQLEAS